MMDPKDSFEELVKTFANYSSVAGLNLNQPFYGWDL